MTSEANYDDGDKSGDECTCGDGDGETCGLYVDVCERADVGGGGD